MSDRADGTARSDPNASRKAPNQRRTSTAVIVVAIMVAAGLAPIVLAQMPTLLGNGNAGQSQGLPIGATPSAKTGGTPSVVTLGNQERQDITAANQWAEGNIDFWLESHFYDTEVRFDAGRGAATVPNIIDFGMSFYFSNKNAITIDWSQDWHVTLAKSAMYWTKSSAPAGDPFTCPTPPNIVPMPVNGKTIQVPINGSICLQGVTANTTGNPSTGWLDIGGLPLAQLNSVLPKRNEPCTSVSSVTGLCVSGTETQSSPAGEHYFAVNFSALFGPSGVSPQSWWPNLPAGMSLALYFRNHLAMTSVWDTAVGGAGGGSQPQFCITTPVGARLNTVYNRCGWTTVARLGAGAAAGSSNHGDVIAPGIGDKTIPLPNVVAPSGFITVCKIVTTYTNDTTGALGALTNNWSVRVQGPFETNETHLTGFSGLGCARFGPLFPANYTVTESVKSGYLNIGVVVNPSADRITGTNPNASNPVNVSISDAEAVAGSGPTVTFVNVIPSPELVENCTYTIKDASGTLVNRTYALVGDTITHNYTVLNDGNIALNITQNHTNTAVFGANPLFTGTLAPGASHSTYRSAVVNQSNIMDLSDSCSSLGVATIGGTTINHTSSARCTVPWAEPNISFEKHPVASDNATVAPGGCLEITVSVTNSGNATAIVNVTDHLNVGQTLLNGGPLTATCGSPSPALSSPAIAGDYAAPVNAVWTNVTVGANQTVNLTFWVVVTATTDGAHVTGNLTLTATNTNGASYTPDPNTAQDLVTVVRPVLKLTEFGYTNSPNGTATSGVVNGTTVYTVVFTNYGSGAALLSGYLNVSVSGGGNGSLTCWASTGPAVLSGCSLGWANVSLAAYGHPGSSVTFTLTVSYHLMPTGALVRAALVASYTSSAGGTVFVPSGVPAKIEFTIEGG